MCILQINFDEERLLVIASEGLKYSWLIDFSGFFDRSSSSLYF